jgi:calcium-dependent protein kinase
MLHPAAGGLAAGVAAPSSSTSSTMAVGVRASGGASASAAGAAAAGGSPAAAALPASSLPRAIPGGKHPARGHGRGRGGAGRTSSSRTGAYGGGGAAASIAAAAPAATAPTAAATPPAAGAAPPDLGYSRGLEAKYEWGKELGRGGNGVVRVVRDRKTGEEWACKSLPKTAPAGAGDRKQRGHLDALRREVEVLRRLDGSLNVVRLVDVYEDDEHVHLVQEWCRGGELHHRVAGGGGGKKGGGGAADQHHYSERTVASFMRAVLRTLAQCHAQHVLHRDVKPGNFMLLDDGARAPLRAIDFGLATPFDPDALPLDNLGLEGTPWYMAPEVLSSKVTPASDVWSAGVMAAQLLTGRLPFDDHRNPVAPSLSAVWRSVLTDDVNYNMPWWQGVSPEARAFVAALLDRDPAKRPTAREALQHPWLRGDSQDRARGKPLDASVVQRLQRFAQNSRFKRSVLQLIAEELLASSAPLAGKGSSAAAAAAAAGTSAGASAAAHEEGPALLASMVDGAATTDEGGSTHHGGGSTHNGGGSTHHSGGGGAGLGGAAAAEGSGRRGASLASGASFGSGGSGAITRPDASPMLALFDRLKFGSADYVDRRQAEEALARMGYRLEPSELGRLVDVVDASHSGRVRRAALAASQIDWRALQRGGGGGGGGGGVLRDEWLDVAARAFRALDTDGDGVLRAEDIVASLRVKLPEDELRATLAQVMEEAGAGALGTLGGASGGAPGAEALDFDGFLRMLRVGSLDSLDLYDDRYQALASMGGGGGGSGHGGAGDSSHGRARAAAAAIAAANELAAAGAGDAGKPWLRPHVTFNFNFGFGGGGGNNEGEGGAGGDKAAGNGAAAAPPLEGRAVDGDLAASFFREASAPAPFDARMHGASLYRNAAVGGGRPGAAPHALSASAQQLNLLATVAE